MVDSFAPRGRGAMCSPQAFDIELYRSKRPRDAYGALLFLQAQPFVRPDRIAVMGWSQGGGDLLFAACQFGRPADALRANREEKVAAALGPPHDGYAIGPDKGLRLQKQQGPIGVSRPLAAIKFDVEGLRRAHRSSAARRKAVDHQHRIAAPGKLSGPIAFAGLDRPARAQEQAPASVQEDHRRMLPLARSPPEVAVEHR